MITVQNISNLEDSAMPRHSLTDYKDAVNRNAELRHKYHGGGEGTLYIASLMSHYRKGFFLCVRVVNHFT